MRKTASRPVQYFSDEYLEQCRAMKPEEILEFLENFRSLHGEGRQASRLISLKIPENLLEAFRGKCRLEGVKYQTQIKRLMSAWLQG
ncbi:MAG: BrnA antitoxin family protein [Acidobacteria bacterium]|nr:BrnA antitoxin family protein [Acidobacteriota bacterium]